MAGEAELDEPLAVEVLRHLLQNLDPLQVILDQVVVSRENRRDLLLRGERRDCYRKIGKLGDWDSINRGTNQCILSNNISPLSTEEIIV